MKIPNDSTLSEWASSLIIDFPTDNVPTLGDEKDWRMWGNNLIQESSFSRNGAPGPGDYKDWRDWAKAVFKTMASFP